MRQQRAHAKLVRAAHNRGQALAEFLVVALALIPLFLLTPMIAKYQDIAHATQMASRYVTFEAMTRNDGMSTWKTEAQLAQEVRRRFFSNPDAPIKDNDSAGDFLAHQNLFWRTPDNRSLINNFESDVTISFGPDAMPTHAGARTGAADGVPFVAARAPLGLRAEGIYRANISVSLLNLPAGLKSYEPFDQINLTMKRQTSALVDSWTARDPAQVDDRIDNPMLFPGSLLSPLQTLVDIPVQAVEFGEVRGPRLGRLDFWRDVVPPDRTP